MLKKLFIIGLILFNSYSSTFAFSENTLDGIEVSRYGTSYAGEELGSRLRRLETDVFGMSQSGNVDDRINNLAKLTLNNPYNQGFRQYNDSYVPKKKGILRRFFDNVTSTFSDPYVTGYTPSINDLGGYGYSGNLSGNGYMNFFNNGRNNYPFNNTYFPNNYGYNYNSGSYKHHPVTGFRPNNGGFNHRPYYRPYYRPNYNSNIQPHVPTDVVRNVATRSTVHIMRDWFYKIKKRT